MACISSPPPKWHNARPQHRMPPPPRPQSYGVASHQASVMSPSRGSKRRNPAVPRSDYRVESSALSQSFMPLKSPMSQCIDTIIGAAEAVNRRDAWIDAHYGVPSKKLKPAAVPNDQPSFILPTHPAVLLGEQPKVEKAVGYQELIEELEVMLANKISYRALILTMALERPRKDKDDQPKDPPPEIREGFYWKEYPELENVLFDEMAEYYSFSSNQRQSKHQQAYNNTLVEKVRSKAEHFGYTFNPKFFTDKRLRDRIRCFYKTHLQNAKKRLHTLKKHLDSPEQRRALKELMTKARNCPEAQIRSLAD